MESAPMEALSLVMLADVTGVSVCACALLPAKTETTNAAQWRIVLQILIIRVINRSVHSITSLPPLATSLQSEL